MKEECVKWSFDTPLDCHWVGLDSGKGHENGLVSEGGDEHRPAEMKVRESHASSKRRVISHYFGIDIGVGNDAEKNGSVQDKAKHCQNENKSRPVPERIDPGDEY